ncbi:class I SAM-dependent methyltransferase [Paeniglutamicibacter kerguelensis]|uniref:Ubiquinone/menaquinone biosynthesis C-methylase UbiE n=1 Tax=Paeniglutamicibacter kerguelensis TaxID=254788 RepID=A0ABS4XED0_9MICC|nr:class I SAM-dependent methyltransferase [Paeniglutamicibacter kerguelensis]MBP2386819.1 ubiquinone/menaquinone biosynthesis C-methylase UbiE [Paeniglutamicibacter kerguelensis]
MSDTEQAISRYTTGDLRDRLHAALRDAGKEPAVLQPADLEESDHFHSGGRAATMDVAKAVGIGLGKRVLDVGSGIGGPARAFATLGAVVTGVDVTNEFVVLARELDAACGMAGSITMVQASAQDTGIPDGSFDAATMIHVGMNLADKAAVFAEVHRLLRPGGVFGIYDLMGTNTLDYPMPWADDAQSSYVESDEAYRNHLRTAGFIVTEDNDRSATALKLMAEQGSAQRENPRPLGAPILLAGDPEDRIGNAVKAMKSGAIAPRLLIAVRPV